MTVNYLKSADDMAAEIFKSELTDGYLKPCLVLLTETMTAHKNIPEAFWRDVARALITLCEMAD